MTAPKNESAQLKYYVIFKALERASAGMEKLNYEENEEIDRLRKVVMEVSEDRPKFFTST